MDTQGTVTLSSVWLISAMIRSLPVVPLIVVACLPSAIADSPDARTMLLTSTVRIVAEKPEDLASVGSGVVVARAANRRQAYILTAAHTLDNAKSITVETFSLDHYPFPAHRFSEASVCLVAWNAKSDLALLRLDTGGAVLQTLPLCPLDKLPSPPFAAIACGCSSGEPQPLLWRIAVKSGGPVMHEGRRLDVWQTDGREPFNGESGGPLANSSGALLGVCLMGSKNHGVYCHLHEIRRFLSTALAHVPNETEHLPGRVSPGPVHASNEESDATPNDLFGP